MGRVDSKANLRTGVDNTDSQVGPNIKLCRSEMT